MSEVRKDILILSLLITLFFGAFLGTRPLTVPDEGRYAEIPREMVQMGDYLTPHINGIKYFEKPPLFYWLQAANLKLFGENQWSVRLGTALMGLLGCLMTYYAGRKLYNRQVGLIAAGILATSTLYYGLSRFITLDIMLSVWLTGCLFSFMLARKYISLDPRVRKDDWVKSKDDGVRLSERYYLWAMYAFAALAVMTKGFIGFIIPGATVFLWLLFTNNWRQLTKYRILSGLIIFFAIATPWHVLVQMKNPEFFKFYIMDQQILRYFTAIADRDQAVWFLPAVLVGGFFPWSFFFFEALIRNIKKMTPDILFLLIWPAVIFGIFWPSQSQLSPYILPMFPPMALLIAICLSNVSGSSRVFSNKIAYDFAENTQDDTLPRHSCESRNLLKKFVDQRVPKPPPFLSSFLFQLIVSLTIATLAWIKWPAPQPYLTITCITLALSGIISFIIYRLKGLLPGIISIMILHGAFLVSLNFSYPPTDLRPIKPLAEKLKPLLKDDTVVASFQHHYHDLPFYLKRNILLVEWYGELKHGMQHQDTTGLAVRERDFWKHWKKPQRMFMILSLKDLRRLKSETSYPFYTLAKTQRNVLVSNQEIK